MSARILIVEDSPTMRMLIRSALEEGGYRVAESEDALQALAVVQEVAPDLVIADVNMPELDGITLVRRMRKFPAFHSVPILILTTESSDEAKQRGRAAGATGWITKPFDPAQLRDVVGEVLRVKAPQ
jgi:two-component system, chemotaxis family, chemotaxis protein CheY